MFEHFTGDRSAALHVARALESASGLDSTAQALVRLYEPFFRRFPRLTAALHGEQLGHAAHPLMTDVPIGLWTAAGVLDVLGGRRAQPAADRLVGLGVIAFFPTATAGWADWSVSDTAVRRVGLVHAIANGAAVVMYGTSWVLRKQDHRGAGVALSLGGAALMTVAGYLGGHMVFRLGAPTGGPEATDRPQPADDTVPGVPRQRASQEDHPVQL
jgi:hypothetical protein